MTILLQLSNSAVAQNLLELLALLLPVAVALLGIMLRSAREDPDQFSFLRSISFFSVSLGIIALIVGAWNILTWFEASNLAPSIETTLQLIVLALSAIAIPMALYGAYVGFVELRGWWNQYPRKNDTDTGSGGNNGK